MVAARAINKFYLPSVFVSLAAGVLYGMSLIFSRASERVWLKSAGIVILILGVLHLVDGIWYLKSDDNIVKANLDKVRPWLSMIGSLVPILFNINFRQEIKDIDGENLNDNQYKFYYNLLGFVSVVAFVLIVFFGVIFAGKAYSTVYWASRNFEKTRKMAEQFQARNFVNAAGEKLRYRLLKPVDYDPQKKYPLVVCLPYGGQPGTDTIRQIEGASAAEILSEDSNRRKYPAFLFVPNVPNGAGWGGVPNYPTVDTLVFQTLDALMQQESGIDVKRCYVTGISRGGYGTWHFITNRPNMFAAAIPVCGGGDPQLAPNIVNVSVWAFHGEKDKNVPVNGSRNMISAIQKAGGRPRYTEYKGEGHDIWYQVSKTPGLWDWLFAQKRN
ncbi:phospholipase [Segetibacter aerophilus]|uniref:Phospholipase n=2 Tax=Segetibacter aerophilus TaxID=670293 RepID=A0A512BFU3_9BACT|nr:phospholipase [Segetibacter aerophilus]